MSLDGESLRDASTEATHSRALAKRLAGYADHFAIGENA
jgi:hypothetical protein